jgi:3-oxoacyl-[acyl-carrier protein] reductase
MAMAFARQGAHLALLDLTFDQTSTQTEDTPPGETRTACYPCDVCNETQVMAAFQQIAADFGRLDVLINNAGITRDALLVKVEDGLVSRRMSLEQWQSVIDVNLTGTFLCGREAAAQMIRFGNGGVIINISSISREGNAGQTNYSASKAAVAAMSVVWAKELARYGLRAASIAPGMTRTDMIATMKTEALDRMARAVPLQRLADVEEIARAAVFIVENDYFTGRCIEVDGGLRL